MAAVETKKSGVFVMPGIGRLVRAERRAGMNRNPATGEAIKLLHDGAPVQHSVVTLKNSWTVREQQAHRTGKRAMLCRTGRSKINKTRRVA